MAGSLRMTAEQVEAHQRRIGRVTVREHICADDKPKRSKFGNKYVVVDNIKFQSLKEAKRYGELKLLQAAGEIRDLQCQVAFELSYRSVAICVYKADFVYRKPVARRWFRVVEDVKGYKRGLAYRLFKIKQALMKSLHGIDVIEV